MAPIWKADIEITQEDAARWIEEQFGALAPARLEPLGVGWDNVAFLVNGQFVFRFPRRQVAAALIARESRWLPRLAPHVPLPIPWPRFVGQPTPDRPYPFSGYALIPGKTACRLAWTEAERAQTAPALARFLSALHRIPVTAETYATAPHDDIRRADLPFRAPKIRERLQAIAPYLPDIHLSALLDRLAVTPPHAERPCWVHGDLYARHLLVADDHRLCGVIDWGDVHLGDPALDISLAFSFLPPAARPLFREAYGGIDDAVWDRARFRALHYGATLSAYGLDVGDEEIRAIGEYALRAVIEP